MALAIALSEFGLHGQVPPLEFPSMVLLKVSGASATGQDSNEGGHAGSVFLGWGVPVEDVGDGALGQLTGSVVLTSGTYNYTSINSQDKIFVDGNVTINCQGRVGGTFMGVFHAGGSAPRLRITVPFRLFLREGFLHP